MRTPREAVAALVLIALIAAPVLAMPRPQHDPPTFVALTPPLVPSPQPIRPHDGVGVHGARPSDPGRPVVRVPEPTARVVAIRPAGGHVSVNSRVARGVASYYCLAGRSRCTVGHPGGLYAAIRRDLLSRLRGHQVTVTTTTAGRSRSVVVTVIDCNCGPNANLIDLYSDAFRRLAPLSQGVVKVTVTW